MGGAERVAANISIYAPKEEFEFHYLVFEGLDDFYQPEVEAQGSRVIRIPPPSVNMISYIRRLASLIKENHYNIVHSHTMFNSGINLMVAKLEGVPIRIAHSHTTRTETTVKIVQRIYEKTMKKMILWAATDLVACGVDAGEWLFGKRAFSKKGRIIHNGIATETFAYSEQNRLKIRSFYGLTLDDYIIGHCGTLIPLKNQEFLIRLMPHICKINPKAKLMLIGQGDEDEKKRLFKIARSQGVLDSVIFCGGVNNVNECLSAMDVFAFPSFREGLPLALVEAQANGLPCVVSSRITSDIALTDLVSFNSLADEAGWIDALTTATRNYPEKYAKIIENEGYEISCALVPLFQTYKGIRRERKAAVSLSFDDARGDNTIVFDKVLQRFSFPATLNITSGYVDGTCSSNLLPSKKAAMSKEDIVRFWKTENIEIALHGDSHLNSFSDCMKCQQKLNQWLDLPNDTKYGFASPGSRLTVKMFRSYEYDPLRKSVLYMRTSLRIRSLKMLRIFCRKAGRVIHFPFLYRIAYSDTIMLFRDGKVIYSIPVMKDVTLGQLKSIIRLCIKQRGSLTLMFHSILPETKNEDNWTWSFNKFEKLCSWLKEQEVAGNVEVLTTLKLFNELDR